ncbi:MAG TPA: hypothetical protein VER26_17875 [Xanthobacteraceae bacterium]|jgi:hypothetical protein|nr:hypothetical protein [Xanthobacteraceae bacterium]
MLVHLLTPLDITTSRLLGAVTVTYQTCSESRSITTAIFAFIDAVAPMTGFWVALAASFDGAFGLDAGTLRADGWRHRDHAQTNCAHNGDSGPRHMAP